MDINWFTVIAQIINFLLLVWLLKRFLYKPILDAVNQREQKITDQLKDAEAKKAVAEQEKADFSKKNEAFDLQKKALMEKAVADSNAERLKLLETAKAEADALRSKLEQASKERLAQENLENAQNIQKKLFAIARKTLTDIASVSLEAQAVDTFIGHLNDLKDAQRKQFAEAFTSKSDPSVVLVQSAFELPVKQQDKIKEAVDTLLKAKTKLQFKIAPELINGIELSTNGYKLAWSFSEYLHSLEKSIST